MKILLLCYEYPPVGGGGGRMAHRVAAALVRRGHQVRVQTAAWKDLPHHEWVEGVEVFRTFGFRRRAEACSVPEMGAYLATSFVPSLRHVWQWKPDMIHAHFAVPTGALAWAVAQLTRCSYFLTCHLGDLPGGTPEQTDGLFRWFGPLIRPVWRGARGISASSSFAVGLAAAAYGCHPKLILNGIPLEPRPLRPLPPPHQVQLLAVGRFNPQKNFPWLLETLAPLATSQNLPPWKLILIGDGPERKQIEDLIRSRNLQNHVTLTGWVSEESLHQHLASSQILLMPSLAEGNPVAALEALNYGLAILGSDTPGLSDLICTGKNGAAISLRQPETYRTELARLLQNPTLLQSYREFSWEWAARFDLETIADQFETFLAGKL